MSRTDRLIVPLDVDSAEIAMNLVAEIGDSVLWYKVGKQLFTREGPDIVRQLKAKGKRVFLDLKFHDIPNTVAQAVRSATELGADIVNVHASGGRAMMAAAAEAKTGDALVIAVTVLTSLDREALEEVGIDAPVDEQVVRLASLAQEAGLAGVVASGKESALIREACGPDFVQVIPGIRPAGSAANDQKRVLTPGDAISCGAHYLVVGRPITKADNPAAAARAIVEEIDSAAGPDS